MLGRTEAHLAAAALLVTCLVPLSATATDATGKWRFEGTDAPAQLVDVVQSGSTLSFTYWGVPFAGTISGSGDFSVQTQPPFSCGGIDGRVLPSGKTLGGRLLLLSRSDCGCCGYPYTAEVVGTRCGCFDGNTTAGDGCNAECQVEPCFTCAGDPSVCTPSGDGAACDDGSVCTTGETCTAGACGGGTPVVPCVDITGDWTIHYNSAFGSADAPTAITQRGDDVVFRNSGRPGYFGTIDPASGAFDLSEVGSGYFCTFNNFDGTVAPDGQTFSGTGTSGASTPMRCFEVDFTATATRGICGNGVLDEPEQCDDGNQVAGDGCDASCHVEPCHACSGQPSVCTPSSGPCDDGNPCTANDACDAGVCRGNPLPDETSCGGETACTNAVCVGGRCSTAGAFVCPPCLACEPGTGCVAATDPCTGSPAGTGAILALRNSPNDFRDKLRWTWPKDDAIAPAALGDPLATTDYHLCLYDVSGAKPVLLFRATAPGGGTCRGKPCWKTIARGGFAYSNPDRTPEGIARIRVAAGPAGTASAKVMAAGRYISGRPFGLPAPALPLPLVMQLKNDAGACFGASYAASGVLQNDPDKGLFRAHAGP